jgi:hypothetical protein
MEIKNKKKFDEYDLCEVFWMGFCVCFAIVMGVIITYLEYNK